MIPAYRFSVSIDTHELGFQEISGIQRESDVEVYQEGGRNASVLVFPKSVNTKQTLILKKGVPLNGTSPFYLIGEAISMMQIKVFGNDGKTVQKMYTLANLIVTKWSVSTLQAQQNEMLIDTFEVSYGELYAIS